MKPILSFLCLLGLLALPLHAASNAPSATAKWIDSISIAPVGVIKTEHLDGPSQWGAGLDLGAGLNPFVSLHLVNLSFEGAGQQTVVTKGKGKHTSTTKVGEDPWGGLLVDETDLQVDAKISRFSTESFSLHLVSGGQYDWDTKDYGINAGLRAELALAKRVALSAGYNIRTWLKGQTRVDSLASMQFTLTF